MPCRRLGLNPSAQREICPAVREGENRGLFRKTNVTDPADVEAAVLPETWPKATPGWLPMARLS